MTWEINPSLSPSLGALATRTVCPHSGTIDRAKLNPNGGSIAIGHPFGATGARVIMQAAYEMARRDLGTSFVSICAGGGLGFSMVLERN